MDNRIKSKWDFLLQCRPDIRGMIGNAKLVGDISTTTLTTSRSSTSSLRKVHSPTMKREMNLKSNCRFVRAV
jgi:hypothetical protein